MSKNNSFRAWGEMTQRSQLPKEEKQKLDALRLKLKTETHPELQAKIKEEIDAVKREYKGKRRSADCSLYAKR
jgi:hypothetical protein